LSRRELALARRSSRGERTTTSVLVDPSRAVGRCVSRGNSWGEPPQLAPAQSQLRYGNGRAGRNLQARRCVDSAADLHDALSPAQAESSTMRWRKKLYDALTVRRRVLPNTTASGPLNYFSHAFLFFFTCLFFLILKMSPDNILYAARNRIPQWIRPGEDRPGDEM
jgi:hypothetical protein